MKLSKHLTLIAIAASLALSACGSDGGSKKTGSTQGELSSDSTKSNNDKGDLNGGQAEKQEQSSSSVIDQRKTGQGQGPGASGPSAELIAESKRCFAFGSKDSCAQAGCSAVGVQKLIYQSECGAASDSFICGPKQEPGGLSTGVFDVYFKSEGSQVSVIAFDEGYDGYIEANGYASCTTSKNAYCACSW